MSIRPLEITILGWLFIVVGVGGFAYHVREIDPENIFAWELLTALVVRLLAVAGGAFLLRGADWSRWLLVAWLTYHVILSAYHPGQQLILHVILLAVISTLLYLPRSNEYFRGPV